MTPRQLHWLLRIWPPFLFSGIRVTHVASNWSRVRVELRERWFNRNYVGTHFGGSLFAMTDPFWMILLLRRLGSGYRVWDAAGAIEFVKPGRGTVQAQFSLDDATLDAIREATAAGNKHLHWFETEIRDAHHELVARIRKRIYVRRKPVR